MQLVVEHRYQCENTKFAYSVSLAFENNRAIHFAARKCHYLGYHNGVLYPYKKSYSYSLPLTHLHDYLRDVIRPFVP